MGMVYMIISNWIQLQIKLMRKNRNMKYLLLRILLLSLLSGCLPNIIFAQDSLQILISGQIVSNRTGYPLADINVSVSKVPVLLNV